MAFDAMAYLESYHTESVITDKLLKSLEKLVAAGEDGVREAALAAPESILTLLNVLSEVIKAQRDEINGLVEHHLTIRDIAGLDQ